ncbi:MAG: J domain-containing protein [Alphaproteobacteria bacterium]
MRKYKKTYQWQELKEEDIEPEHICAHKSCDKAGIYRAPISRSLSGRYQYFCLEHIKEFNRSWNYFEGMSDAQFNREMEHQRLGGQTWPMGFHDAAKNIYFDAERMKDPFKLFCKANQGENQPENPSPWHDVSADELEAMALLGLDMGFVRADLRKAYRQMARKFHPDTSDGEGDIDTIKKINQAYEVLKQLLKRYE